MSRRFDDKKTALDRIKVRRPFDPSLFDAAPAIELPPPEEEPALQEAAAQEEEQRPAQEEASVVQEEVSEVHPEYEEKPVAEGGQQTSEDYHGGTELTFSMPTQRQSGQQGAQQQGGGESAEGEPNKAEEDAGGEAAQEAGEPQEGAKGKGAEEEGQEEPAEGASDEGEQEGRQGGEQSGGEEEAGGSGGAAEEEGQAGADERAAHREAEQHVEGGEEEHEGGGEGGGEESGEGEAEVEESGGEEEWEEGGGEEEESWEGEEESGSQGTSGGYNSAQVVGLEGEGLSPDELRRLQTEFYRLVEMIAEEKTKQFDPSLVAGSLAKAEYDVRRMALRRFEGKPPAYYKMPRVRESVVLILDNSGSMVPYANMLRALADVAARRRDVEIYIAPNGHVEEELAPVERPVDHGEFMRRTAGRKVIYVGDFDGANTPIELSWRNDVIWIAPEERYRKFLSHNWVRYGEDKFKGTFVRAFSIDDILAGIRKALSGARWIDMCDVCGDEEEQQ
jgi:hypothetical protein